MTTQITEQTWLVAVNDLLTWEEENHQLLPNGMTAELIADLEEQGIVVCLETGQAFDELTMMAVDLATLQLTDVEWSTPFARLTDDQLAEIEDDRDEAIGDEISHNPWAW